MTMLPPDRSAAARLAKLLRRAAPACLAALMAAPALAAQLTQLTPLQQLQERNLPPDATGRIEQRFREAPTPPPGPTQPLLQVEPPPAEEAPQSAADIPLQIESLTITGVTAYKLEELEPYWKDRIGKPGRLGDLFEIASQITARYRNDGYVLSRAIVPAQEIEGGKVEIRVVEGYVARVIFEGNDDRPDILRATGERITDVKPIRINDLERYMVLLNDLPGVSATSVLKPSPDQTGAADLVITIERDMMQNFTTLDDRGTRYVGPIQYTLGTRISSPFGLGDQTFIRAITTPEFVDELMAFDFANQQILDEEGTTLTLGANFAQAHPGFTLAPLKLTSDASTLGFTLMHPLIRSRTETLKVNVQLSGNQYRTGTAFAADPILRDNIRSFRAGVEYDLTDDFRGSNQALFEFSQGLQVLGASKPGQAFLSRAVGRPDYTKLNFDLSRAQGIGGSWTLIAGLTAQTAFTSLLASEQFGLGGSTFLRAYDASDLVGDSGIAGRFQLQWGDRPETWYLKNYDLYSYFDIGQTQNLVQVPGEKTTDAAIAIGLGTHFTLTEWSNGYLEVAQPIMRGVPTEGTHDHFPRVFFALIAKF